MTNELAPISDATSDFSFTPSDNGDYDATAVELYIYFSNLFRKDLGEFLKPCDSSDCGCLKDRVQWLQDQFKKGIDMVLEENKENI